MPDLMNFSITRLANANLSVPRWSIEGQFVDSQTQQTVLRDFMGANAVLFPNVLGNLTDEQQDRWVESVIRDLLHQRFGV